MPEIDDVQQSKKIDEIRNKEEESFVERVAERFKLPYINLSGVSIETDALAVISEKEARETLIAPFKITGSDLYVGVKSPNLPQTERMLEKLAQKYTLGVHMVSTKSLEKAWERYADISRTSTEAKGVLDIAGDEVDRIAQEIKTNVDVAKALEIILTDDKKHNLSRVMEIIFGGAIATGSSDVHFETQEEQVRLRFRQDGVLQDVFDFQPEVYAQLLSRIKLLSEMKLTQTKNAQDGRFTIEYHEQEIEVRVSVIPSAYGESFVMRILNPENIQVGFEALGIEPKLFEILSREIQKPNGMILISGPTGSGKTTTLYSFLRKVYTPEVKIITIEDPVEYHLEGISQTQVHREKNYTFVNGLRAALRQDPDIIMLGEIRDTETASVAVNASLTGHLLLSTLHTNNAAGVIPRLIDLDINPQILASALSVSLAQRLVRKLCEHCKEEVAPSKEEEGYIRNILQEAKQNEKRLEDYGLSADQAITLFEAKGCEHCNNTGYKGRIGIFEAIITDERIEELLNREPSEQEVRRAAEKQGLLNMREDGVLKILQGITSFKEVAHVVDLDVDHSQQETKQENVSLKKVDETHSLPKKFNPDIVLDTKSVEISLLIDYLRKLEYEQTVNPQLDASDKIQLIQKTILELLKQKQIEESLGGREAIDAHNHFKKVTNELETLYQEQQKDPQKDISQDLQRIRKEMEAFEQNT